MTSFSQCKPQYDLLYPIRHWLEAIEIHNPKLAYLLCKLIPAQCPFEHDIVVWGRKLLLSR